MDSQWLAIGDQERGSVMRVALVNPSWDYTGSIYFGCRAPHLPLELGYAKALLEHHGHDALIFDGQIEEDDNEALAQRVGAYHPDLTVVTTAPSYLFWRCPPPELRIPADLIARLGRHQTQIVAIGPHGSVTPAPVLKKLNADFVIRGESEESIVRLAEQDDPATIPGLAYFQDTRLYSRPPHAGVFRDLPALHWPDSWIQNHHHHHHRFDEHEVCAGAEVEASRGCPYHCSFCAKNEFRDAYRKRDLTILLEEIDHLINQSVSYVYFIDEIFLPDRALLEALKDRPVQFGVQTRIDLWKPDLIKLLGEAGCVSIEAGVESLSVEGREKLAKQCRMDNDALADRLILARNSIPFVQANLLATRDDQTDIVSSWRAKLAQHDVWTNDPVPLFPYPSSPDYHRLFGPPDEKAWERAHAHYLNEFSALSDLQDRSPQTLETLERSCCSI